MRKWKPYANCRDNLAWFNGTDLFPTPGGAYRTTPQWKGWGTAAAGPATPGTTGVAWAVTPLEYSPFGIVGTSTKLYECSSTANFASGTFTDRSGAVYTANNWQVTMYGLVVIATNFSDAVQAVTYPIGGNFAALAGSPPKARYVCTQSNAVLLFAYNDGVNTFEDGWWASDVGDHTTWTPAASNDAANGRILARPGKITAAVAFRDEVIVFKESSIFRMRYVGAPVYWTVDLVSDGAGAYGTGGVCNCGDFLLFMGRAGVFRYDGAGMQKVSTGFEYAGTSSNALLVAAGPGTGLWYPETGDAVFCFGGTIMVYNVNSDSWGRQVDYLSYNSAGSAAFYSGYKYLYGDFESRRGFVNSSKYGKWNGQNDDAFGMVAVNLSANPCVVADTVQVTSTDFPVMYLATEYIGDERVMTNVTRVIPVFTHSQFTNLTMGANARYTLNVYTFDRPHGLNFGSLTPTQTITSTTGQFRFDLNITARFFRFELVCNAPCEVLDLIIESRQQGLQ